MLKPGDNAPHFEGLDQSGEVLKLSDFIGKNLVLYFYPKDLTPGCTIQAKNLTDNMADLQSHGYAVVGVSADSVERHCKFSDKIGIRFSLLSDESLAVIKSYGVWGEKKFMGRTYDGIKRTTFLINSEGVITHVIDKVKTKSHSQQILGLLEEKIK